MDSEENKQGSDADAELEGEVRRERKFSLGEAIGRLAGPGAMKGASPIARRQQVETEIANYLGEHLTDAAGALPRVLLRQLKGSEQLLGNYDQPLAALAAYLESVLASDYALTEVVRQADVEWGQIAGERPHFEREDGAADADDPYTVESVRRTLTNLLRGLRPRKA